MFSRDQGGLWRRVTDITLGPAEGWSPLHGPSRVNES